MRTKIIVTFLLTLFILLAFSSLVGAQIQSPTYVSPPIGVGVAPRLPKEDGLLPQLPREDELLPPGAPGEGIATPRTGGGLTAGASAILGLLLLSSAMTFKRR